MRALTEIMFTLGRHYKRLVIAARLPKNLKKNTSLQKKALWVMTPEGYLKTIMPEVDPDISLLFPPVFLAKYRLLGLWGVTMSVKVHSPPCF